MLSMKRMTVRTRVRMERRTVVRIRMMIRSRARIKIKDRTRMTPNKQRTRMKKLRLSEESCARLAPWVKRTTSHHFLSTASASLFVSAHLVQVRYSPEHQLTTSSTVFTVS